MTIGAPTSSQLPQTIALPDISQGHTNIVTIVATCAAGGAVLSISMLLVWHVRKGKTLVIVQPALATPTVNLFSALLYQSGQLPVSGTMMQVSQFPAQPFLQRSMQLPTPLSQITAQPFQKVALLRPMHLSQFPTRLFQQGSMQRPSQLSVLSPHTNKTLSFDETSFFPGTEHASTMSDSILHSMLDTNATQTLATASPTMQFE